ncbi:MAG TPA: DUF1223 domain-containing protein [Burkholderiaceae bacterium]|jgi:hypothetical protein
MSFTPLLASSRARGLLASLLAVSIAGPAWAAPVCSVHSAATITPVVELYTSEGCNSCPPADKWLSSSVKADAPVVALAFHVDYWDRLGWTDRFASPAFTRRQAEQMKSSGARFSYTPQVLIDGADRPDWPAASITGRTRPAATVSAELTRDANRVTATVTPLPGAPARIAAFWAVTEQDYVSAVKAGENQGVTLHHDFVVRDYRPVAAWAAKPAAATLQLDLPPASDPAHLRLVNLVITDADTGRPVQALKLGC